MQIAQALRQARQTLVESGSAKLDAELLLGHCLQCERTYLFAYPERELPPAVSAAYFHLIDKRAAGHPVAHLVGKREFWSMPLRVTAETLIPRPETECLVEAALQLLPEHEKVAVLDLGTGSGAIALALASERPEAVITATDINEAALEVAKTNAAQLGLDQIRFIHSDWYDFNPSQRFHIIVSNPPYISPDDEHLQQGDVRFESRTALVANANGLAALETIATHAAPFMHAEGWLLLEHGYQQGEAVRQLLLRGGFDNVTTGLDHAGHERFTLGQLPA